MLVETKQPIVRLTIVMMSAITIIPRIITTIAVIPIMIIAIPTAIITIPITIIRPAISPTQSPINLLSARLILLIFLLLRIIRRRTHGCSHGSTARHSYQRPDVTAPRPSGNPADGRPDNRAKRTTRIGTCPCITPTTAQQQQRTDRYHHHFLHNRHVFLMIHAAKIIILRQQRKRVFPKPC